MHLAGHAKPAKARDLTRRHFNPGCWYNAITLATSTDGGYTFTHAPAPSHLVASVPYKYVQSDAPYGYFSPSNVIKQPDGYYYSMIQTEAYGLQKLGECVIRSKTPASVTSWRAWDGTGYNVKFINPYTNPDPPDTHVCEPVSFPEIDKMVQSLTLSSFFGKYLLVGQSYDYEQGTGRVVYGAYYSTSTDLIHWSHRTLLMEAELPWSYQCGDENPIAYPVVLNPGSTARNFDTTKQINYLYFTRFNYVNCLPTWDLDLVRIPFKFLGPSPTN